MDRRNFLKHALQLGGSLSALGLLTRCGTELARIENGQRAARVANEVTLYDTFAMALYMDGGLGPKTGIIKVDYLLKNEPVTLEFWHGHGGESHFFTVEPSHFKELKTLKKVYVLTTEVASHTHRLFIDMSDPKWRVPGAKPVTVPVESLG